MNDWRQEMAGALKAFVTVAQSAGVSLRFDEFVVEYWPAPHRPPSRLPDGTMAIYAFWWNGVWLKIGQAGSKSQARYTSHHYNPHSSNSNLSKSLIADPRMRDASGFGASDPGKWIRTSACRANILLPATRGKELLSLLEAFLHVRLKPRYEG